MTAAQVAERVARGETNDFKIQIGRTYPEILRDNIFNLFNVVLAALGVAMIIFQDYTNLLFASFSVILNSIVGLVQEISAKRALDRLAAMAAQPVKARRDGKVVEVPVNEVVKDDVIPVEPGDRIVVDGTLIAADSLEMNESLLTGEADSIPKEVDGLLCSGSFVIAGSGVMVATQVGAASTINKLSATAKQYRHPLTPTQRYINSLVQVAVFVMILFGPMTAIAGYASRLEGREVVRNAVVLVTSMVPQGLVLATTISLTIGALIISRNRTLVQRINAVESLANVDVLCFDKTGTLTRNVLAVSEIVPLNGTAPHMLKQQLHQYVANLAHQNRTAGAIAEYAGVDAKSNGAQNATKQHEVPFTSARKWGAITFLDGTFILGAPERVLREGKDSAALERCNELAAQGQRVLAFSRAAEGPNNGTLPAEREALALVVMSDQMRTEIQDTIRAFTEQNVELKVISGDNLETVSSIAHQSGMKHAKAYTGEQLEKMSNGEFDAAVREANVFARIEPETKRKILRSLKRQGLYVAMVGDGVNDVPALKEANMAVAMNDGAQIAKDVADIVLLDNSMATLPLAFEKGKIITQKIFGTTRIFLTKNFYTVLAFFFIGFMALPFSTTPILISWLTFGLVNVPGGLIAFGVLRPTQLRSFRDDVMRYVIAGTIVGGLFMAALYAGLFLVLTAGDHTPAAELAARDTARSALLVFMSLYGLVIFWNTVGVDVFEPQTLLRRWRTTLLGVLLVIITVAAPYAIPNLFEGFTPPTPSIWIATLAVAALAVMALHVLRNNKRFVDALGQVPAEQQA